MSNDYFKAQGWFKNYALNSQDSRGVFQQLVKEDEEAFRLASAETDRIKDMINEKFGPGTMKPASELPPIQNPFKDFEERNPAAEGGRIGFDKGLDVLPFKKLKNGKYSLRLYLGTENGKRIEKTFTGTKAELRKIYKDRGVRTGASVFENTIEYADSKGIPYKVKQGENKGKFAIRGPKEKEFSFYDTEELAQEHIDNYRAETDSVGGDRTGELENKKYKKGYKTKKQFLEFLAENDIAGKNASSFAMNFNINTEVNPYNNNAYIYDTSQFTSEKIEEIQKAQVTSGSATEEAKKKFPVKTKSELQKPRLDAIEAQGGVKKNDPYAGKRGSGIELGHTGNIYGTELITGDRLAYTPTEVNQLMGKEGNLDDKIRSVSAKIEKIKASDKPANVKKDLLEQADTILIRLSSQSQGFKKVTLSGGGTFGGDRLTVDYLGIYPGKTEVEIRDMQNKYLNKKIITEKMVEKNPKLVVTPPEEIQKIQDAFFFEKNRKEVMKAAKKIGKKEIKKIKENINIDFIDGKKDFVGFSSGFNTDLLMKDPAVQKLLNSKAGQAVKNAARGTAGTVGKVFGVADILIGALDYENNISKGQTEKEALGNAVQAMSFGLYKSGDRARIADVKERFVAKGGDGEIFDQATALNAKDQEINDLIFDSKKKADTFVRYAKEGRGVLTPDPEKSKADYNVLKKNLNEAIKNKIQERDNMVESYKTNLQVSEAGGPIQIGGNEFFSQPFKDIKSATMDKIREENRKAYDMQKRQVNFTSGNIGNWLQNNIFTMSPLERAELQKQINNMDERELYKFNLERGMDPDNLIRFEDILRYKTNDPALMGVNTTKYINYDDRKAEGGITTLRSKYEYKK
jgi:hypothetical protein